jgi:hypothetical protein
MSGTGRVRTWTGPPRSRTSRAIINEHQPGTLLAGSRLTESIDFAGTLFVLRYPVPAVMRQRGERHRRYLMRGATIHRVGDNPKAVNDSEGRVVV